jgi:hypothetical protein
MLTKEEIQVVNEDTNLRNWRRVTDAIDMAIPKLLHEARKKLEKKGTFEATQTLTLAASEHLWGFDEKQAAEKYAREKLAQMKVELPSMRVYIHPPYKSYTAMFTGFTTRAQITINLVFPASR